ncbi:hypothetical protein SD340_002939 [Vibrio fluvialis]|uniref:phosphatidylinositol-specific phospholipase C/glycerophosphodiester phosphodiesterase family protein n=1 Tax=Vibrio fluvialis TaxID=676 RepID=UPI001F210C77|nr:phosphatidylinositol-specific phospholipase C/glycerophosphodiester phosphodiesterase family protein [Vibrio fluvialis]EKO3373813.1 hypothetical protein [Vibrio fluvialis]EKO3450755.1 hypothetical protein [Vibrio fluvialis]EKO3459792.1 hypothetical protein [Vibrio fluvialis]EKO3464602.1 hypothetical protein [Vibrio fluvialis]EKO3505127.1 hypothetical protein [Vibrio fluvialis]
MQIIAHRINTISALMTTPSQYGVEVDIRSFGNQLIIHHDPFVQGENFELWLDKFDHKTLILNVKEEGLESRLINLMKKKGIEDYFFLDQSFPFLIKWSNNGERRCAARVSEYESIDTALELKGKIDWIWVDCFNELALTCTEAKLLKEAGFKLCLVSPELQGRTEDRDIINIQTLIIERDIHFDAVCTKQPLLWETFNNE